MCNWKNNIKLVLLGENLIKNLESVEELRVINAASSNQLDKLNNPDNWSKIEQTNSQQKKKTIHKLRKGLTRSIAGYIIFLLDITYECMTGDSS